MNRRVRRALVLLLAAVLTTATAASATADDPVPDTTAPQILSVDGSPVAVTSTSPVTLSWTATDDVPGPLAFDVCVHDTYRYDPVYWECPGAAQGLTRTTYDYAPRRPETTVCLRVRATDAGGNTSEWSASRCTYVDGGPPRTEQRNDLEWGHTGLSGSQIPFRYLGTDDDRVASYDVAYRLALAGKTIGSWVSPAGWQGITVTTVHRTAPAGSEICFRARGRDRAGNVGRYSVPWCTAMPYDDRSLTGHDGARRTTTKGALGGTVTVLTGSRASLTRSGVRGKAIHVRIRGNRGCPRVWLAGVLLQHGNACSIQEEGAWSWATVYAPRTLQGTLTIRSASLYVQTVDAVAVGR